VVRDRRLRFNVLGPVEAFDGRRILTPSAPQVRRVLALLLVRAGQRVLVSDLIDELWADRPPKTAVTTVQTYVYQLRQILGSDCLITQPCGYALPVSQGTVDIHVFDALYARGRALLSRRRHAAAADTLRKALDVWTGPSLSNVIRGRLLEAHATNLDERRLRALELRIQADAALGRHGEMVGELRMLVVAHPFNERFHAQLMVALSRCGRRGEALQAYDDLRRLLNDQLGLDPDPELQRLYREALT
jgi:SARP family transcriptional regulator, regulator of embCAB operon